MKLTKNKFSIYRNTLKVLKGKNFDGIHQQWSLFKIEENIIIIQIPNKIKKRILLLSISINDNKMFVHNKLFLKNK